MDGTTFRRGFLFSEVAGFGFGLPVAAAYALLMVTIEQDLLGSIIRFIAAVAVVIVGLVAFPVNLSLGGRYRRIIDRIKAREIVPEETTAVFTDLMSLPMRHGIYLFARVGGGAVICGLYLKFWLDVPPLQAAIGVALALYGAYMAGIVAYMIVLSLIRPVSQHMVAENMVDREAIYRKRYFSAGLVGKIAMFIIVPILFTNLSLLLVIVSSIAGSLSNQAILVKTFGVVIVNIVSLAAGVVLTVRTIKKPVERVKGSLGVIAMNEGNLTQRIPSDLSDDFAYISFLMNEAIGSFSDIVGKVRSVCDLIAESSQNLSVSAQEIATTSNEQAAAVKEIVSTMEDSDELAKTIGTRIEEVNGIAVKTKQAVDEGFALIKGSLSKMEEIRESNDGVSAGIKFLGERIDNIWEIVNIINTIANRTRIIAFNAELEATAAGDAGKNFQIVATEIRRLADNTTASTNEIKSRIKEIQDSSDRLVKTSELSTKNVIAGHEVSSELNNVFENILKSTDTSVSSVQQMQTSVRQQVGAFEQILMTLKQISVGINNFVESTKLTSKSTQTLRSMAEELSGIVGRYAL
jgi:methyl-accepting chemotaxis protein